MLEFLDPEDRYVVKVVRLTVEAARLPADVKETFREWVLMDLLMRGREQLSDYFFEVARLNGIIDDEDESLLFSTFLASELYRFLRTARGSGCSLAPKAKPEPQPEPALPRVASPIGPALPPTMAASAREAGHVLSPFEDPDDRMWELPETPLPDDEDSYDSADEASLHDVSIDHLPLVVKATGRSAGCGVTTFGRACLVAACADGFPGRPPGGRFGRCEGSRPPDTTPAARPGALPGAHAWPSDFFRVGLRDDGRLRPPSGLRALVEDVFFRAAVRDLGEEPPLTDALSWVLAKPGRAYGGALTVSARFHGGGHSPRVARWFIHREDGGEFSVVTILGTLSGREAPLASGLFSS